MSGGKHTAELKPCPFCGCKVSLVGRTSRDVWGGTRTWYHVEGEHKGVGGSCPGEVRGRGSAETAITAWNTRAEGIENPAAFREVFDELVEAATGMASDVQGMIDCVDNCGEWGAECPMQDVTKPDSTVDRLQRLLDTLAKAKEITQ